MRAGLFAGVAPAPVPCSAGQPQIRREDTAHLAIVRCLSGAEEKERKGGDDGDGDEATYRGISIFVIYTAGPWLGGMRYGGAGQSLSLSLSLSVSLCRSQSLSRSRSRSGRRRRERVSGRRRAGVDGEKSWLLRLISDDTTAGQKRGHFRNTSEPGGTRGIFNL